MAGRAAQILLALLPTVYAFSNTHPIVAWSSHSSNALHLASDFKSVDPVVFIDSILLNDNVCEHDAIVLVDHVGLHASDLRTLLPSSGIAQSLNLAASSLEVPYMSRSTSNPFTNVARSVAERCSAQLVQYVPGHIETLPAGKEKYVVCMEMPALEATTGSERKNQMAEHESHLSSSLASLSEAFPNYLVVYAGWNPSLYARQVPSPFSSELVVNSTAAFAPPSGGILARYQLLTPGLILSLLIGFFVLIPTIMIGISALASIQSPLQGEAPKGYIAAEKKNQ